MAKRGKIAAILLNKCPRCHEGDMFKTGITGGIYNMNEPCPYCGQRFETEPGFFWGAMYVGYGLSGGYMLSSVTLLMFVAGLSVNMAFLVAILGAIVILPINARLARSIWIHIYVGYDKELVDEIEEQKQHTVDA